MGRDDIADADNHSPRERGIPGSRVVVVVVEDTGTDVVVDDGAPTVEEVGVVTVVEALSGSAEEHGENYESCKRPDGCLRRALGASLRGHQSSV